MAFICIKSDAESQRHWPAAKSGGSCKPPIWARCKPTTLLPTAASDRDFATTIVRNFFYSAFMVLLWDRLQTSSDSQLAAIASKSLKETRYHLRHARDWLVRMGDGSAESHARAQSAVDHLFAYTQEFWTRSAHEQDALRAGWGADATALQADWNAIVDAALGLATQIGLEGLSIGALAEVARMSKSGVFAHFGSREELQISVVREYHQRFETEVFLPILKVERGLPRLRQLFANWTQRTSAEIDSGCLYISGAAEFDDRPGPVREALASSVKTWLAAVYRTVVQARDEGHLAADMDAEQMVFELHGLILALQYEARFLRSSKSLARTTQGFENILQRK